MWIVCRGLLLRVTSVVRLKCGLFFDWNLLCWAVVGIYFVGLWLLLVGLWMTVMMCCFGVLCCVAFWGSTLWVGFVVCLCLINFLVLGSVFALCLFPFVLGCDYVNMVVTVRGFRVLLLRGIVCF